MKSLSIIFLAVVLIAFHHSKEVSTKGINDKIFKLIEGFKDILKNGNETLGIPVMDPFLIDHQELSTNLDLFSGSVILNETELIGLSDFVVENADITMVGLKLKLKFRWSKLRGSVSSYNVKGLLLNFIAVYGKGYLKFAVEDLSFSTNVSISVNKEKKTLYIGEINSAVSFEVLKFSMDGLFNDNDLSDVISAIVSDLGPTVAKTYQKQLTEKINEIVKSKVDNILSTITLKDFLAIIKG